MNLYCTLIICLSVFIGSNITPGYASKREGLMFGNIAILPSPGKQLTPGRIERVLAGQLPKAIPMQSLDSPPRQPKFNDEDIDERLSVDQLRLLIRDFQDENLKLRGSLERLRKEGPLDTEEEDPGLTHDFQQFKLAFLAPQSRTQVHLKNFLDAMLERQSVTIAFEFLAFMDKMFAQVGQEYEKTRDPRPFESFASFMGQVADHGVLGKIVEQRTAKLEEEEHLRYMAHAEETKTGINVEEASSEFPMLNLLRLDSSKIKSITTEQWIALTESLKYQPMQVIEVVYLFFMKDAYFRKQLTSNDNSFVTFARVCKSCFVKTEHIPREMRTFALKAFDTLMGDVSQYFMVDYQARHDECVDLTGEIYRNWSSFDEVTVASRFKSHPLLALRLVTDPWTSLNKLERQHFDRLLGLLDYLDPEGLDTVIYHLALPGTYLKDETTQNFRRFLDALYMRRSESLSSQACEMIEAQMFKLWVQDKFNLDF